MGTEAPRRWRELLEQLQLARAAATDNSDAGQLQPANMQAICDIAGGLDDLDKLPKAVWKKVLALQVKWVVGKLTPALGGASRFPRPQGARAPVSTAVMSKHNLASISPFLSQAAYCRCHA
jgi:hypothetical protein